MNTFKIIHIIHSLAPGGAENLVRALAKVQRRDGNAVDVFTVGPPVDITANAYAERFREDLKLAGIGWHQLTLAKTPHAALTQLEPHLSLGPRSIVHCHIFRGLPALLTLQRSSARVVYTHHNSTYPVPPWLLYWVANRSADVFVSVCLSTDYEAKARFRGPSRMIHNGITLSSYRVHEPMRVPACPVRLVMIGSFTAQKNHLRAVEIMSILGPKYHLTIFGTGPLEQRILDAARDLGVDNIELPGVSSTLPNALARFDLMIQTSDWEGMPLSLIEGHAAGLPIVATNVGDTAAIVADSLTGYLVPRDAPAVLMAEKVRQATKEATYTALSQAARTRSLQFDIMNTAKNYANLYHHAFADAQ